MDEEEFTLTVKKPAVNKWITGCEQTQKTFPKWWENTGTDECSFCSAFYNDCGRCALYCSKQEWGEIDNLMESRSPDYDYKERISKKTFAEIHTLCQMELNRIKAVEYKDDYEGIEI